MQITLEIPDEIALHLESRKDNLPQILALGLREITANPSTGFSGLTEILEFFAKLPSPQEILALHLTPAIQAEIEDLLAKNRAEQSVALKTEQIDPEVLRRMLACSPFGCAATVSGTVDRLWNIPILTYPNVVFTEGNQPVAQNPIKTNPVSSIKKAPPSIIV